MVIKTCALFILHFSLQENHRTLVFPCLVEFVSQGKIWSCPKMTSLSGLYFQNYEWVDYISNPHKGWETWGENWRKRDLGGERKRGKCGSPNSSMIPRPWNPMNCRDPKAVSSQLPGKWQDLSGQNGSSQGHRLKTLGIQVLAKTSMLQLKRSKELHPAPQPRAHARVMPWVVYAV